MDWGGATRCDDGRDGTTAGGRWVGTTGAAVEGGAGLGFCRRRRVTDLGWEVWEKFHYVQSNTLNFKAVFAMGCSQLGTVARKTERFISA